VQLIPIGKGKPNSTAITAGADGKIDTTTLSGDDTVIGNAITTGPDGICQTTKAGDDVQVIAVGNGEPNSIIITAGSDNFLHSNKVGDDVLDLSNAIVVNHSINFSGIDCCAEACVHELKHKELYNMPGTDSDGDHIPDSYELSSSYHLDPNKSDTYDCAGTIGYGTDNEFLARMAEKTPGPRDASKDWSDTNGKNW